MGLSVMKSLLPFEIWSRRALRAAVMVAVVAIALGWGTSWLKKFSFVKPFVLTASAAESQPALADEGTLPDLGGAIGWLNSDPLNRKLLRGKVVLVDFWTYTCINSLRPLPYVKSWATKYKDTGLVVIGVHTPEFSFEKERVNVENALRDLKVTYPVAIDSNYRIWQAFNNQYWPAQYLIDGKGRIRYHHFGEGEYGESERVIQALLKENGATGLAESTVSIFADGVEAVSRPQPLFASCSINPNSITLGTATTIAAATTGGYAHEREALEFLRDILPDRDPIYLYSNFEFIADDGSVNEIDALVVTRLFLAITFLQRGQVHPQRVTTNKLQPGN